MSPPKYRYATPEEYTGILKKCETCGATFFPRMTADGYVGMYRYKKKKRCDACGKVHQSLVTKVRMAHRDNPNHPVSNEAREAQVEARNRKMHDPEVYDRWYAALTSETAVALRSLNNRWKRYTPEQAAQMKKEMVQRSLARPWVSKEEQTRRTAERLEFLFTKYNKYCPCGAAIYPVVQPCGSAEGEPGYARRKYCSNKCVGLYRNQK